MTRLNLLPPALRSFRRPAAALLILLLAMLVSACGGPQVVLTGIVKDAYTGNPIQSANVTVGGTTLTTDANGSFSTPRWSKSDTLAVTAPNYEAVSLPLETQPQVAASDALTVTLDTTLRPNTLSGTIIDAYTGKPLPGANLALTVNVSETLSVSSGADGSYTFSGVPEQFTLNVSAPEYASVETRLSRTTRQDLELRPNVLGGTITDRFSGKGVAGAKVAVGTAQTTTGADGGFRVENIPVDADTIEISAEGYATLSEAIDRRTQIEAALRPDTLQGQLIDKATGKPIRNAALLATTTLSSTDVAFTRIVNQTDGHFTLKGVPEQGYLQVLAPGYRKAVIEIKPGSVPSEIALERFEVKALYITAAVASSSKAVDEYIDLIERTELNAIVIDIKSDLRDDLGTVYYDTQVPLAKELGLSNGRIDMRALVQKLKAKGIYTVARVQLFSHDNALSDARPEWSIHLRETGEVYADYPGPGIRYAYLDPTNKNVWDYNIQLGVEAALMGFDEINYDYIRFPDWYDELPTYAKTLVFSEPIDPEKNPDRMFEVLTEFMEQAHRAVNGAGAKMSIDVFGRVVLGPSLTIAQDIKRMGKYTDYIAPMPYPSLWWPGAFGLDSPVEQPFAVIDAATKDGVEQIRSEYARLRPWLQDHTDPWAYKVVEYGAPEVRAQIDAAEQYSEIGGWMLYDSSNAYKGAFSGAVKPEE